MIDLPPLWSVVGASVVVALGAFVQGTLGFGAALVAAPILALIDPRTVPASMLALTLLLATLTTLRDRRSISVKRIGWALTGRVPGTAMGAAALAVLSQRDISLLFAALVLVAVAMSVWGRPVAVRRLTLVLAGVMSGVMGTVASMGGPPLALLYQREAGRSLRADLSGYFVVGVTMSLAAVVAVGRFGRHEAVWALLLTPAVLVGFAASGRSVGRLDSASTRTAVLIVSGLAAAAVIAKQIALPR